jgi:HK97 family phage major capsid protein/HK97 family phage prohead protease
MQRAYSVFTVKSVDVERRTLSGVATTPEPDRVGDIIEPLGVKFKNPLPLLLYHDAQRPVGTVTFDKPTKDGVTFEARLADVDGPPSLKERIEEAWQSIKARLVRGVSIGFRALDGGMEPLEKTGGWRFTKTEVLELSLVTIPANAAATITSIKAYDLAVPGNGLGASQNTPGASGTPVVKLLSSRSEHAMKTIAEQLVSFKSTRDQKWTEMNEIMTKAGERGETLNAEESDRYEHLKSEVKAADDHIKRLEEMELFQKSAAKPVPVADPMAQHATSGNGNGHQPVIRVQTNEEPGIGFAKAVLCKTASFLSQGMMSPLDVAKARYPDNDRVHAYLKAAIPAGTTTHVTWAAPFIDPTNLASEFIDYLRPMTILGKFGTNGIPSLRRVPFNVRLLGQTSGGDAYWVGEGAPKPVTKFDFNAQTLGYHKIAAIAVITEELARFSSPSAERIVRDSLAAAVSARADIDLIDPAQSAVTGVNPASLTNGLTALAPSGTTADAARADVARIVKAYLDNNNDVTNLVLIMPASLGLSLSVMRNSLGQREFGDMGIRGGSLEGIPVITTQYAANQSGAGNLLIAVNASDVLLADDGQVTVDASREASLQMLDNPTNSSATATATTMVSMWQTNSIALRAERFITWSKARANAVVYMDDVNWGTIGSPA